jgi:hypothetical protein
MPDNSVDCIITDPPYNISKEGNKIQRNYEHYNWDRRSDIGLDFGNGTDVGKPKKTFLILRKAGLRNGTSVKRKRMDLYIFWQTNDRYF